jgi:hypothetical protein
MGKDKLTADASGFIQTDSKNVNNEDNPVFISDRNRSLPPLDYLKVFTELYSPPVSQLAMKTPDKFDIICHFNQEA